MHAHIAAAVAAKGRPLRQISYRTLTPGIVTPADGILCDQASTASSTYDRTSTTQPIILVEAANKVRCAKNANGNVGLVIERTRTERFLYNRDPTQTGAGAWAGAGTAPASVNRSDPAGGTTAARFTIGSGAFGRYANAVGGITGNSIISCWMNSPGGATGWQHLCSPTAIARGGVLGAAGTWALKSMLSNVNNPAIIPADGRDDTAFGGVAAQALDVDVWGVSIHNGVTWRSPIKTLGAAVTQVGDRHYHGAADFATFVDRGRLQIELRIAVSDKYSDNVFPVRLFSTTGGATDSCELAADGSVTMSVGGVTNTCPAGTVTWANATDIIDFSVALGGSQPSAFSYRVSADNGVTWGAEVHGVVTGVILGNVVTAGTSIEYFCSGSTKTLDGLLQDITAHPMGYGPSWVKPMRRIIDAFGSSAQMQDCPGDAAKTNFRYRNPQAMSLPITTSALVIGCHFWNVTGIGGAGANNHITAVNHSDGALLGVIVRSNVNVDSYGELALAPGVKTIRLIESSQQLANAAPNALNTNRGNYIKGIYVPDGYGTSVAAPIAPAYRIVVFGTSITEGFDTSNSETMGPWALIRARISGRVSLHAGINQALSYAVSAAGSASAFAAELLAMMDSSAAGSAFVFDIGPNDYFLATQTAAAFQTQLTAVATALRLLTALPFYFCTLTKEKAGTSFPAEGTNNAFGANNAQSDYRTAIVNAAAAVASSTVINLNIGVASDVSPDGGHLVAGAYPSTGYGLIAATILTAGGWT